MEVRETAACGITEREFAIDLTETEIVKLYRLLRYAMRERGDYDAQFTEELIASMEHIVGPSLNM